MVNEIVSLLAQERKKQGMSLEILSIKSGVSIKHICNIENFKAVPSLQVLCKISEPLGMTIDVQAIKQTDLAPTG